MGTYWRTGCTSLYIPLRFLQLGTYFLRFCIWFDIQDLSCIGFLFFKIGESEINFARDSVDGKVWLSVVSQNVSKTCDFSSSDQEDRLTYPTGETGKNKTYD